MRVQLTKGALKLPSKTVWTHTKKAQERNKKQGSPEKKRETIKNRVAKKKLRGKRLGRTLTPGRYCRGKKK